MDKKIKRFLRALARIAKENKWLKYPIMALLCAMDAVCGLCHVVKTLTYPRIRRRILASVLSLCMVFTLLPMTGFAEEPVQGVSALCEHHTEHTPECGYTEAVEGVPCGFIPDETEEASPSHGALQETEKTAHMHDEECGYIEAVAGTACGFVCEVCSGAEELPPVDSGAAEQQPALLSDVMPLADTIGTDWVLDANGLLTISTDAGMGDWVANGKTNAAAVKKVALADAVTAIDDGAFSSCGNLTSAAGSKVTAIGNSAFNACKQLTTANFPKAVTVGNSGFYECWLLTEIDFSEVKTIGEMAFYETNLSTPEFPEVTAINGAGAFFSAKLTSISLPKVTEISGQAFMKCSSLAEIALPASPPIVRDKAFDNCANTRYINFVDKDGTPLTGGALSTAKDEYDTAEDGLWYGWIIDQPKDRITVKIDGTEVVSTSLQDAIGVKTATLKKLEITGGSFLNSDWNYLKKLTAMDTFIMADTVTSVAVMPQAGIAERLFPQSIKSVSIKQASITALSNYAFYGCASLTDTDFQGITKIGNSTFQGCTSLASATFPKVTFIDEVAFYGCTTLASLSLPAKPPEVKWNLLFDNCPTARNLKFVDQNGDGLKGDTLNKAIAAYAKDGKDGLWYGWTIPTAVESYGIYVGDTLIDANNMDDVLDDDKVTYDPDKQILTLNGVTIDDENKYVYDDREHYIGIFSEETTPLKLELKGTNNITIGAEAGACSGILLSSSLTISGDGTLNINVSSAGANTGIKSEGLTVNGGTLKIATGSAGANFGIFSEGGFTLENGSLKVITGKAAYENCGMYAKTSIKVTSGVVDITAGEISDEEYASLGMYCDDKSDTAMSITGGTVTAAAKGSVGEILQAILPAPNFSGYTGCIAVGSTNADGSGAVTYSAADNDSYKYVKIYTVKPVTPPSHNGGSSSGGTVTPPTTPAKGESTVTAPVDQNGNASVAVTDKNISDAIAQAKKEAVQGQPIAVSIRVETDKAATQITATLPKTVQETLISNKVDSVIIASNTVTMGFSQTAIRQMNNQAKADITITAAKMDTKKLTGEAKALIGSRPMYNFTATYGGDKRITDFGNNTVSIAIPYTLAKGETAGNIQAVYVDDNGKVTPITTSNYDANENAITFTTSHFSGYGVGYKQTATAFTDIDNHWAKADIEFAAARGLLSGTGNNMFSPNTAMTRGMFITALGRMAVIDQSGYKSGSFTDVKADAYYAPYVNWAVAENIVNGTATTTFSPNQAITRQEMTVIMQSYAKARNDTMPKNRELVTFADNGFIAGWAAEAVKSMQMAGVVNGKDGNRFDPTGLATRAEVSAVLHRYIELVIDKATAQGEI